MEMHVYVIIIEYYGIINVYNVQLVHRLIKHKLAAIVNQDILIMYKLIDVM